MEALARLHLTVTRAYKVNTDINFEVFIHKVDGLSDDHKIETQRDIHQRANDDLADAGLEKIHLRWEQKPFRVHCNEWEKADLGDKDTTSGLTWALICPIVSSILCYRHWDCIWEKQGLHVLMLIFGKSSGVKKTFLEQMVKAKVLSPFEKLGTQNPWMQSRLIDAEVYNSW